MGLVQEISCCLTSRELSHATVGLCHAASYLRFVSMRWESLTSFRLIPQRNEILECCQMEKTMLSLELRSNYNEPILWMD